MQWKSSAREQWDGDVALILAHGAGQGIDSPFMKFFHEALPRRGILSIQFNFEYMDHGRKVPDPQAKLQALYRKIVAETTDAFHPRRLFIGGKSMGGRVASYIAGDTTGVTGLVFLGYPLHPPGNMDKMRDEHLYNTHVPMLFLSGSRDPFAEPALLEKVVHRIGPRAVLQWTERGDHSLKVGKTGTAPLEVAADAIAEWARRTSP